MSDDGKPHGYRIEYAASSRSTCKGAQPCKGTKIDKGALRFGSLYDFQGNTTFGWRHWGCMTARVFQNVKKLHEEATELDGFDDLNPEDKARVIKAWEDGHVADEDIPDSARKPAKGDGEEDDEDEKPKKKAAPRKKKADGEKPAPKKRAPKKKAKKDDSDDDGEDFSKEVEGVEGSDADDFEAPKPKPKKAPAKKKAKKDDDDDEMDVDEEKKPAKKTKAPAKKRATKAKKEDDDADHGEDDAEEETGKKRKKPATKSAKPPAKKAKGKKAVQEDDDDE